MTTLALQHFVIGFCVNPGQCQLSSVKPSSGSVPVVIAVTVVMAATAVMLPQ